ncbi:MAG: putative transposase [Candidatus Microthrix parvicella]|jgi:transposase
MAVTASGKDWAMVPLPMGPGGSTPVAPGVDVLFDADGAGSVFLWGMAAWYWAAGDDSARRLAAVQIVDNGHAPQRAVAGVFGVNVTTLWRWRKDYTEAGTGALVNEPKGPKRRWKLTDDMVGSIVSKRAEGATLQEIATRFEVSTDTVRRALASVPTTMCEPALAPKPEPATDPGLGSESGDGPVLVPLARPEAREGERQAARRGVLAGAAPVFCEGASLPLAGALVILPALAATGLLDAMDSVFKPVKAAFYGMRSLVLTLVFAGLVGEPRAEGLTRLNPVDLGRLLGLDRAPEVRTVRQRMAALGDQACGDQLFKELAARHIEVNPEACGVFYVDGHVRAYHGKAKVPKAHVARIRMSMPAELDTWISDGRGDGVLVWQAEPGASLVGELKRVATEIRELVGPDARPTIIFDRGGWSPKLFAQLDTAGFDIATYRKNKVTLEPVNRFNTHEFVDDLSRTQTYLLADRNVRLAYTHNKTKRLFGCRQIVRLDPTSGHQTQIITTRTDPDPGPLAYAMFSRWRQENFFRYMREHYALEALDTYQTVPDDPERTVPNPAKKAAAKQVRQAKKELAEAEAVEGRAHHTPGRTEAGDQIVADALNIQRNELAELKKAARAIPTRVPVTDIQPAAARLDDNTKRTHDAIRMSTYNAETGLARLLAPHYNRAKHEARSLLREIFNSPADLHTHNNQLHVTIWPLSNPRRTSALKLLCDDLTATQTTYPGTNLTLTYTVKNP